MRFLMAVTMLVAGLFAASVHLALVSLVCGVLSTSWFFSWHSHRRQAL